MFAAAVDAFERLFVEQATETVLAGCFVHQRHEQHVLVDGQIAFFVYGCELELVWCHLVVARFAWNAQFESLYFEVFHKLGHTSGNGSEVVVVHLLVLGRVVSHEGAPCE